MTVITIAAAIIMLILTIFLIATKGMTGVIISAMVWVSFGSSISRTIEVQDSMIRIGDKTVSIIESLVDDHIDLERRVVLLELKQQNGDKRNDRNKKRSMGPGIQRELEMHNNESTAYPERKLDNGNRMREGGERQIPMASESIRQGSKSTGRSDHPVQTTDANNVSGKRPG